MLNEMIYTAKSKNRTAKSVLLGLLGSSILLIIAANIAKMLTGIIWIGAFIFITATIYVYNRYVGAAYRYTVSEGIAKPALTIDQSVGKAVKTVARLDLDSITEVRRMTGKEYRAYRCEKGVIKYPYFPTMLADEIYLVSVRSEYENYDVFIEIDEKFASALSSYITNVL